MSIVAPPTAAIAQVQAAGPITRVDIAIDQVEAAIRIERALWSSTFIAARGLASAKLLRQVFIPAALEHHRTVIQASVDRRRTDLSTPDLDFLARSSENALLPMASLDAPDQASLAAGISEFLRTANLEDPLLGRPSEGILLVELFRDPEASLLAAISESANSGLTVWLHSPLNRHVDSLLSQFANQLILQPTPAEVDLASEIRWLRREQVTTAMRVADFALIGGMGAEDTACWTVISLDRPDELTKESARKTKPTKRAIVMTALPVEYMAFRSRLKGWRSTSHRGSQYEVGKLEAPHIVWDVLLAEIGAGNPASAAEAERAIEYFDPDVALFVGVAGALKSKDVALGDVVIAPRVYEYASGKETEAGFAARPELMNSAYGLVQLAHVVIRRKRWQSRIRTQSGRSPRAIVKPIASGERVLASTSGQSLDIIASHYQDALAVEMEGFGFLRAAHQNKRVAAIVIRGVSDALAGKEQADASGSQEHAARNASAFAVSLLKVIDESDLH